MGQSSQNHRSTVMTPLKAPTVHICWPIHWDQLPDLGLVRLRFNVSAIYSIPGKRVGWMAALNMIRLCQILHCTRRQTQSRNVFSAYVDAQTNKQHSGKGTLLLCLVPHPLAQDWVSVIFEHKCLRPCSSPIRDASQGQGEQFLARHLTSLSSVTPSSRRASKKLLTGTP